MAQDVVQLSIFLSSPGDLGPERGIVQQVCEEINLDLGRRERFRVDLVRWETHVRPGVGESAQDVINSQIGSSYDIYLGLLGPRFGTATKKWRSGTEEEFRLAYERFRSSGTPDILFYFADKQVNLAEIDADQLSLVRKFRDELQKLGVLYGSFSDEGQLRTFLHRQISASILKILKQDDLQARALAEIEVPQFDPLENWHDLVASDAEMAFASLESEAVAAFAQYTKLVSDLGKSVKSFASSLARTAKKMNRASNQKKIKEIVGSIRETTRAIDDYSSSLMRYIPRMNSASDEAFTKVQRALNISISQKIVSQSELHDLLSNLDELEKSITLARDAVAPNLSAMDGLDETVAVLRTRKKKIMALHKDLMATLSQTIEMAKDARHFICNNMVEGRQA